MKAKKIPATWISCVIKILSTGSSQHIAWTLTAQQDWSQFGMTGDAYELLIETLSQPLVVGHAVVGMRDSRDGTYIDTWEFLCKHPCKSPIPLYCKIGLHGSKLYINLISLHVDDGSQKLQNAIEAFLKAQK